MKYQQQSHHTTPHHTTDSAATNKQEKEKKSHGKGTNKIKIKIKKRRQRRSRQESRRVCDSHPAQPIALHWTNTTTHKHYHQSSVQERSDMSTHPEKEKKNEIVQCRNQSRSKENKTNHHKRDNQRRDIEKPRETIIQNTTSNGHMDCFHSVTLTLQLTSAPALSKANTTSRCPFSLAK